MVAEAGHGEQHGAAVGPASTGHSRMQDAAPPRQQSQGQARCHQLERIRGGHRCLVCGWTWRTRPTSTCPGVERFAWWDSVPTHLMTATQLRRAGLAPGEVPRGCIVQQAGRETVWLYDEQEATPRRRSTPAQRAALVRARQAREEHRAAREQAREDAELEAELAEGEAEVQERQADRAAAVRWAARLLARADGWVILDTETTGLLEDTEAEVVQIAVVAPDGTPLLDTLVRPEHGIPAEATAVHGLEAADVAGAPFFGAVYPRLAALLSGRTVVTYNAGFDSAVLARTCTRHGLPRLPVRAWHCAMAHYAAWIGDWSDYHADYRWQPLPGAEHSALGDCQATLHLLQRMAASGS